MRLIDADEMLDNESIAYINAQSSKTISALTRDVNKAVHAKIQMLIADAPTVEAKPVVKGEWKYDWLGEYICSNCYERVTVKEVMGEPAWDWCPACGADMRGEKHD